MKNPGIVFVGIALLALLATAWSTAAAGTLLNVPQVVDEVTFEAEFTVDDSGRTGTLRVRAEIIPNWHIFSMTEQNSQPTSVRIASDFTGAAISGDFVPDADPHLKEYSFYDQPSEEYEFSVTWTAPLQFAANVDPATLKIPLVINGQVCENNGICLPIENLEITATAVAKDTKYDGEIRLAESYTTVRGWIEPQRAQPGETVNLNLQLEPDAGWQVFQYSPRAATSFNATLIVLTKKNDAKVLETTSSSEPQSVPEGSGGVHAQAVTWTTPIQLPKRGDAESYAFTGWLGFLSVEQTGNTQSEPVAVAFHFTVEAGDGTGSANIRFSRPDGVSYERVADEASRQYETGRQTAGPFAGFSLPAILVFAFIAGLILNIMPCVLPVIGLKILSFVQQAGEHPGRVLMLNLTFAAGMMLVFMLLAALAAFFNVGWGGLFESQTFTIVMVAVIFAFGLSFFGVWEIPIPGFAVATSAGKMAESEGYSGAFTKGVLTTLLATPCSGPLLIPAVTWAINQPPWLTFLVFFSLGLGMAFPYILIGFKPSLVGFLPKPGAWMQTFKQLMGFVMMGTAVFFLNSISEKLSISVLTFMVFIGLACWMAGRISLTSSFGVRARGWLQAVAVIGVGIFVSFSLLIPQHELEWVPFSRQVLNEAVADGNTVFIDFTADW